MNLDILINEMMAEAKSWIGTPYEHQGQIKGKAIDCVHYVDIVLVKSVGSKLGLNLVIPHNYNPKEDGSVMLTLLKSVLEFVPIPERKFGDIVAFIDPDLRDPDHPSHLAFIDKVTDVTTYIVEAGRQGVVRHRLDGYWVKRIHSVWRLNFAKVAEYLTKQDAIAVTK